MMDGIKTEGNNILCASCNQKVSKDGTLKLNFCPKCGNPLNINASVKLEKHISHQKTIMLYELLDEISQGKNAEQQIKNYIKELNKD